jgi:rhodanese-related sulfurtransferase
MKLKLGFKQMLAAANAAIETVSVPDAIQIHGEAGYAFIDIREEGERAKSTIAGSVHVPRGFLEFQADPDSPMHNRVFSSGDRLVLFCASGGGQRSRQRPWSIWGSPMSAIWLAVWPRGRKPGARRSERTSRAGSRSSGSGRFSRPYRRFPDQCGHRSCACRA